MAHRPRVLRSTNEQVTLPRYLVVETAMDAATVAEDISRALAAIEQRVWGNNRAGAIAEIGRATARLEQSRSYFLELAGIADVTPTDPASHVVAEAA